MDGTIDKTRKGVEHRKANFSSEFEIILRGQASGHSGFLALGLSLFSLLSHNKDFFAFA